MLQRNRGNRRKILLLILSGKSNKAISEDIKISVKGVKYHVTNIYKHYEVKSRLELFVKLKDKIAMV